MFLHPRLDCLSSTQCDDEEEEKLPGLRRAGRIAGKKWKKENGIQCKTKDMTDEQKVNKPVKNLEGLDGRRRADTLAAVESAIAHAIARSRRFCFIGGGVDGGTETTKRVFHEVSETFLGVLSRFLSTTPFLSSDLSPALPPSLPPPRFLLPGLPPATDTLQKQIRAVKRQARREFRKQARKEG